MLCGKLAKKYGYISILGMVRMQFSCCIIPTMTLEKNCIVVEEQYCGNGSLLSIFLALEVYCYLLVYIVHIVTSLPVFPQSCVCLPVAKIHRALS